MDATDVGNNMQSFLTSIIFFAVKKLAKNKFLLIISQFLIVNIYIDRKFVRNYLV